MESTIRSLGPSWARVRVQKTAFNQSPARTQRWSHGEEEVRDRIGTEDGEDHRFKFPKTSRQIEEHSQNALARRSALPIQPDPHNPRTHSKRQIRRIADSIRTFGFTNPILVDERGQVMAGHARLEAAKRLGLSQVPTIRIGDLNEAQKRAYLIADNRLAELSGWDEELLAIELQTLTTIDLDFDIEITGFETAEIDTLIAGLNGAGNEDELVWSPILPQHD